MSSAIRKSTATLDDLYKVDGKAELIAGEIVHLMAAGYRPGMIASKIFISLNQHACASGRGVALTDNMGFAIAELPSGRESFAPDASYYEGSLPINEMDFISGAPRFAVEVRSKNDYGNAPEVESAAKRLDYFQAGTAVVWDVDPMAHCIRSYDAQAPDQPVIYQKGQVAKAGSAVPGWRLRWMTCSRETSDRAEIPGRA